MVQETGQRMMQESLTNVSEVAKNWSCAVYIFFSQVDEVNVKTGTVYDTQILLGYCYRERFNYVLYYERIRWCCISTSKNKWSLMTYQIVAFELVLDLNAEQQHDKEDGYCCRCCA